MPGRVIAIPRSPGELSAVEVDLDEIRRGYLRRAVGDRLLDSLGDVDLEYLAAEVGGLPVATVAGWLEAESRGAGARA